MNDPTVITLVHGTFAKNAAWTKRDSSFAKMLTEELSGMPGQVHFEQVNWSGRNWFRSRQKAAKSIHNALNEQESRYNNPNQIVIGHSHGGSALAYLISSIGVKPRCLKGCVFLSTPFVDARARRDWELLCSILLALLLVVPFSLLVVIYLLALLKDLPNFLDLNEVVHYLALSPIAIGIVCIYYYIRPSRLKKRYDVEGLASKLSTSNLGEVDTLIIKTTADEALGALSATHFISWLFTALLDFTLKPFRWILGYKVLSVMLLLALIVLVSIAIPSAIMLVGINELAKGMAEAGLSSSASSADSKAQTDLGADIFTFLMLSSLFAALLVFGYLVIFIFVSIVSIFAHISFGRLSIASALFMELAVEAVPRGKHLVLRIPWEEELDVGLSHSGAYQSEDVAKYVGDWIVSRCASIPRSPSNA